MISLLLLWLHQNIVILNIMEWLFIGRYCMTSAHIFGNTSCSCQCQCCTERDIIQQMTTVKYLLMFMLCYDSATSVSCWFLSFFSFFKVWFILFLIGQRQFIGNLCTSISLNSIMMLDLCPNQHHSVPYCQWIIMNVDHAKIPYLYV